MREASTRLIRSFPRIRIAPVQADAVLGNLGHETVDSASNGSQPHENVGALVSCGQDALYGRELSAKAPERGKAAYVFCARFREICRLYQRCRVGRFIPCKKSTGESAAEPR
jgi:hypothetical protein